ncbi:Histidine ammonia-lyase [Holothuria leucospilota]|uniref:Histidine ammonia-lyase n=1 Tax=Holothuria leucospilota TaxID=206669 RepID=A0A9Q1CLV8_HOLLE|nr:Histidine ammonia-lyase [Holothuria leucospilota]
MKVNVRVRGEWLLIPCKAKANSALTIQWLGKEAFHRYKSLKNYSTSQDDIKEIRLARGGSLLYPGDNITDVLEDNDFIHLVLKEDSEVTTSSGSEALSYTQMPHSEIVYLDGESLTADELVKLGSGRYKIELTAKAWDRVAKSRELVEKILKEQKVVYGISTGFGNFAKVVISPEKLKVLQENLIRSHSAGVGEPLTPEHTRKLLALRINVLAKGYSGISPGTLQKLIAAFNASCLSWVPQKGTVAASGDLAPLAHLALGLMGEGKMWSPKSGWGDAQVILKSYGLEPLKLLPKEGLALINGTQLVTALGAEAVERAGNIARQADVIAALTLEVLKGTTTAFESAVHNIRPHRGQREVAWRLRALLHSQTHPSEISQSHRFCGKVQDAYTLRCCPQVHGVVHDTIDFVRGIITTEMNSATDNPIVFTEQNEILSAGNFHGEYPAKVLDYLAIGVHELANMSERRIERLINPDLSGLPAFLVKDGGLNSGFMIAHCTAAALVSENKVLTHPASVDSLPTSAGQEDHVSMGGFSARKALQVVEHVEQVLAIELLAACQGIEFLRPLKTTAPLEAVHSLVRSVVPALESDRIMSVDIDAVSKLLVEEKVWDTVKPYIDEYEAYQLKEMRVASPTATTLSSSSRLKRKRVRTSSNNSNMKQI